MARGINERLNLFCTKRLFALVRKNVFTLTSQMVVSFDDSLHKFTCERAHLEMFKKGRPLQKNKNKIPTTWKVTGRAFCLPQAKHTNQIYSLPLDPIGNNFPIITMGDSGCASPPRGELPCSAVFN